MRTTLFFLALLFVLLCTAQFKGYEGYYTFPINPGSQNYLAGTIGEIRASHFHTGIDVKTGGEIGLPIYAIADGYISRIKISIGGYGHSLYMTHPNGTTSLYAHLNAYSEKVEKAIRKRQYEKESYAIEVFPKKDELLFNQGEIIGYSGNTGSSSGPHLHFEIRDKDQNPLDLLQFGFSEIKDRIAPMVKKIAFITLNDKARVNNLFGRYEFDLIHVDNAFRTNVPIELSGKIGVEIYSYDLMDGIPNKNGIIKTLMVIDGDTLFHENKQSLSFSRQRNALKHYNYEASRKGSRRFNKLYLDDGNEHNIYKEVNRGIHFKEKTKIKIFTQDSYDNLSVTEVEVNGKKVVYPPKVRFKSYESLGNHMHFKSKNGAGVLIDQWAPLTPYHSDGDNNFYLWNISDGLPKNIFIDGETIETNLVASIPPKQKISYHQEEFESLFGTRTLFDTLHLRFKKEVDSIRKLELFRFQNPIDPIRGSIKISLKPTEKYQEEKCHVYSVYGKRFNFMGGKWSENQITFSTRDLVTYTILADTIPPQVKAVRSTLHHNTFRIEDERSGIKSFRAELDGKFILMRYEAKKKLIWPITGNPNIPITGELKLEVIDNANNKTIFTQSI